MNKNIVILIFSHRNNGNCANIGEYLKDYYKRTNVCLYFMDFSPCNDCDYECLKPDAVCPAVTEQQEQIMNTICSSDLVYFIVPNYCGYPSANYFAFNERSVGYFKMDRAKMARYMAVQKRFIIVSNTEPNFAAAMRQQTNEEPVILYLKSGKYHKRSIAGDILDSSEAIADLKHFLDQNG